MRICVFLLPDSMPLTVRLCLVVASALLLLLCSTTSCLGSQYQDCGLFPCGAFFFVYPFGQIGSGCGDPAFQLDCDDHSEHPLLDISGEQYRILEPSFLAANNNSNSITIINDKLWGGKCNLSGNYSQFWLSGSHFHIANTYTNLTLWRHCDEKNMGIFQKLRLCDYDWYYFSRQELGTRFCKIHLQVPIKKFLIENQRFKESALQINQNSLTDTQHINVSAPPIHQNFSWHTNGSAVQTNQSFVGQGFQIIWYVDTNRHRSCGACLKSKGSCGYNISKPTTFLCHCPDNTSHSSKCPSRAIGTFLDRVLKI